MSPAARVFTEQPGRAVTADLTYIVRQDTKPYFESSRLTGGEPKVYFRTEQVSAEIQDMRNIKAKLSIDVQGFEILHRPTKVTDLQDDGAIESEYNQELIAMLKVHTGADSVVIFDHTRRSDTPGGATNQDGLRGPASRVHCDYTVKSGPQRAKYTMGEAEVERVISSGGRIVQVNVWRPIKGPVRRSPLALADAGSIPADDLIATDQHFPDRIGEIYQLARGAGHRWYFASEMQPDEVILIKGWDSIDDGRALFTPHGAFHHPDETTETPARESIETRTHLVFEAR
ncbi:CmcJ/NvfI family oxidoreductase [Ponticaulis sp.]|uniref:CmcJ/NvfI family oxidoreductase n=1 Tax=Ponticaulis sp. TaxID=2020902 RepID=UPI000C39BA5D|nr:CmcJ/NvfI family oxidoreductase [Ponticaulis sp.]MBN06151.1 methyltransferase [Ponticaulis sp.]